MDGGAWWATVHGVARSQTRLSDFPFPFHFHALEKEMASHSSILAWRIPGMGEPGELPSMGLHRVGHNWSDLAAAAAAGHTGPEEGGGSHLQKGLNVTSRKCKWNSISVTYLDFLKFIFNWRTVALQCCKYTTWISRKYTPPTHPTPPRHHRAPSWAPCITQQLPNRYLLYTWYSVLNLTLLSF